MTLLTRRSALFGLLAAPALIRPGVLMSVRAPKVWLPGMPAAEWLSDAIRDALTDAISSSAPVRYDDAGLALIRDAVGEVLAYTDAEFRPTVNVKIIT